jgi:hypothetical protein
VRFGRLSLGHCGFSSQAHAGHGRPYCYEHGTLSIASMFLARFAPGVARVRSARRRWGGILQSEIALQALLGQGLKQ